MTRVLVFRAAVFFVLVFGFWGGTVALPAVTRHFARLLPDNYEANARAALAEGDAERARRICERRIERNMYDFDAHYLLAEVLEQLGDFDGAAHAYREVFRKYPAVRGGRRESRGYDEGRIFDGAARAYWRAGRYQMAAAFARAAIDAGFSVPRFEILDRYAPEPVGVAAMEARALLALKIREYDAFRAMVTGMAGLSKDGEFAALMLRTLWASEIDRNPHWAQELLREAANLEPGNPLPALATAAVLERENFGDHARGFRDAAAETTGTRVIAPGSFSLPEGGSVREPALLLGRTSRATAQLSTGVFSVRHLVVGASGSRAVGQWPLLSIEANGTEIAVFYLDSPHWYPRLAYIWPEGAPRTLELTLAFLNDAYDPITRADRNVRVDALLLY